MAIWISVDDIRDRMSSAHHNRNEANIMKLQPGDDDELIDRRNQIAERLTQACCSFITAHSACGLTASEQVQFREYLAQPYGFVLVSRHLRDVIVRLSNPVQSAPIWDLIDAIGFWEDSHPGKWPYTRHDDFQRFLNWANEYAMTAFAVTSDCVQPTA